MSRGELKAMIISHPHFYTSYVEWNSTFKCPLYISSDDTDWLCRTPPPDCLVKYLEGSTGSCHEIIEGVTAVKAGGHFPGSLVLHWHKQVFIADTIMTVPVSHKTHASVVKNRVSEKICSLHILHTLVYPARAATLSSGPFQI